MYSAKFSLFANTNILMNTPNNEYFNNYLKLLTEYNMRSRELVTSDPQIEYDSWQSYTHDLYDFETFEPQKESLPFLKKREALFFFIRK